jgi:acyl-CoA thioester hydrolase/1,4-dihydroxy-2-naphthoyl-CoA hydrolase
MQPETTATTKPFTYSNTIRFRDADPAGISFFAGVYGFAHDAYEEFVKGLGFEWSYWFENPEWIVPIRHSECLYLRPMPVGSGFTITVKIDSISASSMTVKYDFSIGTTAVAEVKLVHVFVVKDKFKPRPIPPDVREKLEAYQRKSGGA